MENHASDGGGGFEWRKLLNEALLETDPEKLKQRVAIAEAAMFERLKALDSTSDAEERLALQDATSVLLALKSDARRHPPSEAA